MMRIITFVCLLGFSVSAWGQALPMKPGQWIYDVDIKVDGKRFDTKTEMLNVIEGLTQKERDNAEELLRVTEGMRRPQDLAWNASEGPYLQCFTPSDIEAGLEARLARLSHCTFENVNRTGNRWSTAYTCTRNGQKHFGNMSIVFINDTSYSLTTRAKTESGRSLQGIYNSKWSQDTCQ